MITLELSDEEALNLRNLLDVAVRGGGMRAAELAVVIDKKIIEAAQRSEAAKIKAISTPATPATQGPTTLLRRDDGAGRLPDTYIHDQGSR